MLNGGYILLDLTKYTFESGTGVTLTDDEINKFNLALTGKPLMIKLQYEDYLYVGYVMLHKDTDAIHFMLFNYDSDTAYANANIDLANKDITIFNY